MSAFRFIVNDVSTQIFSAFTPKGDHAESMYGVIANAATDTMREAGDQLKKQGRANIAAGGFSAKWQNAWRVNVYPKKGVSIDSSVWGYHKIAYSLIFETGGQIVGKRGLLWIPLGNVPKIGRFRATPRRLSQSGVKLVSMHGKGKPLLGAAVRLSRAQAGAEKIKVSLGKLRSGTKGVRGEVRTIPLFVGVPSVRLPKKFNISGVAGTIQGQLGNMYFANLRAE